MLNLIILGAVAVGFFVFGVLFGRANPKKVTAVVNEVDKLTGHGTTAPAAPVTSSVTSSTAPKA